MSRMRAFHDLMRLFIGDGIVVMLAVGLSDELLLQLVEPCLDTVRDHYVGIHYRKEQPGTTGY